MQRRREPRLCVQRRTSDPRRPTSQWGGAVQASLMCCLPWTIAFAAVRCMQAVVDAATEFPFSQQGACPVHLCKASQSIPWSFMVLVRHLLARAPPVRGQTSSGARRVQRQAVPAAAVLGSPRPTRYLLLTMLVYIPSPYLTRACGVARSQRWAVCARGRVMLPQQRCSCNIPSIHASAHEAAIASIAPRLLLSQEPDHTSSRPDQGSTGGEAKAGRDQSSGKAPGRFELPSFSRGPAKPSAQGKGSYAGVNEVLLLCFAWHDSCCMSSGKQVPA